MNVVKEIQRINAREASSSTAFSESGSWHDQYKDSAHVFIGGIPFNLTEGDVICVFSQFGEVLEINLVRDKETGKSKGFCFLKYVDQRSTVLAVDNMNGTTIAGRTVRVDHVQNYKVPKKLDEDGNEIEQDEEMINNVAPKMQTAEIDSDASSSESEVDDTGIDIDDPMREYLLKKRKKEARKAKRRSEKAEKAESKAERKARREARKLKDSAIKEGYKESKRDENRMDTELSPRPKQTSGPSSSLSLTTSIAKTTSSARGESDVGKDSRHYRRSASPTHRSTSGSRFKDHRDLKNSRDYHQSDREGRHGYSSGRSRDRSLPRRDDNRESDRDRPSSSFYSSSSSQRRHDSRSPSPRRGGGYSGSRSKDENVSSRNRYDSRDRDRDREHDRGNRNRYRSPSPHRRS